MPFCVASVCALTNTLSPSTTVIELISYSPESVIFAVVDTRHGSLLDSLPLKPSNRDVEVVIFSHKKTRLFMGGLWLVFV